jgi:hypothetical protein
MNWIWAIGVLIASFLIQVLTAPKPVKPKAASLDEFDFPQADEGTAQCVFFGEGWAMDMSPLWFGNYRTSAVKSSGGKK